MGQGTVGCLHSQRISCSDAESHPEPLALQEARIPAHHNIAQRLWKGIKDASKGWTIVTEKTVEGLLGLPQPEDQG